MLGRPVYGYSHRRQATSSPATRLQRPVLCMTSSPNAAKPHFLKMPTPRVLPAGTLSSDAFSVLNLALQIELDPLRVREWLIETRIRELGDRTAAELLACGRAREVVCFLQSVQARERYPGP